MSYLNVWEAHVIERIRIFLGRARIEEYPKRVVPKIKTAPPAPVEAFSSMKPVLALAARNDDLMAPVYEAVERELRAAGLKS